MLVRLHDDLDRLGPEPNVEIPVPSFCEVLQHLPGSVSRPTVKQEDFVYQFWIGVLEECRQRCLRELLPVPRQEQDPYFPG